MIILCLSCSYASGIWEAFLFALPFAILIIVNPKIHNEFIVINETGITCKKSEKQLWKYEWEDISELKSSSRFLLPSVEIISYNKHGASEQFAKPGHYFQSGKTAKAAIKLYYNKSGECFRNDKEKKQSASELIHIFKKF